MMLSLGFILLGLGLFFISIVEPLYINSKRRIPGPRLFALTKWRLAWEDYRGRRTRTIHRLHQAYGPVIRIGPNEVHFNSLTALRKIYGAGSGFERTTFYRMFDVYGRQNLFTFHSSSQHGERKKLLANAYSKSAILQSRTNVDSLLRNVREYMALLERQEGKDNNVFETLHYFSLDSITNFLYGPRLGGTSAVSGSAADRKLLDDIHDPSRRSLSSFAVHVPKLTKWLYSRSGVLEACVRPILPMQKPATYTAIRVHALKAMRDTRAAFDTDCLDGDAGPTIIGRLFKQQHAVAKDGRPAGLADLDMASECADHLLAGIDTTADTLTFLFWALSLPENKHMQKRLIEEVSNANGELDGNGNLTPTAADKLTYLDAVMKETLRLYAPLPASEPRCYPYGNTFIDGYTIPTGTVVSMSPYSLHRNAEVFPDPLKFKPDRWLDKTNTEAAKWFWAFSSGGRMCIGIQ